MILTRMSLYGTSNALICQIFPATIRGWYAIREINNFEELAKTFESYFMESSRMTAGLDCSMSFIWGWDEPLSTFVKRYVR